MICKRLLLFIINKITHNMLSTKSHFRNYLRWLYSLVGTFAVVTFSSALSENEDEEVLNLTFQVYIWRTSTSIENLVGTEPPTTKTPSQKNNLLEEDPPMGDVTALYVAPEIKFLSDGIAAVQSIRASEGRLSREQRYRGPNPLIFFNEKVVDGETVRLPLGEVTITPSLRRVLLLFLPMPGGAPGYRILPLDNSLDLVPNGEALIYNFTGGELATQVGDNQFVLPAGKYRRISMREIDNFRMPIQLAMQNESGAWEVIHRQNSVVNPDSSLLFLIHRAEGTSNLLRIITLEN